ncbi:helix-turn-helix domain-containing protein [Dehalococcoides mccartyi]|uniref:Helix-turn-helix family protein n=1 Tax=Dehalococcoides mccartyi TaxID=61435 RepID=A0A142V849_9CHLR|nr:helix-turn-helix transcriptional regulator [Dehalococcoides mccartyi]AMU86003.1 Helix-turn-helix family protein [Dehalococcoides mccartyi]
MIKNERQYKITKAQMERLQQSLTEIESSSVKEKNIHPLLLKAELEGINSQITDLRSEIQEYEELRAGHYAIPSLDTFAEFPLVLIKARIAQGFTQKELAERLGLKEQQIQKYESTEYASASLSRIREVAEALGVQFEDNLIRQPSKISLASLINRLKEAGLDRDLIMKRIIPASLSEQIRVGDSNASDNLVYQVARHIGRIFNWNPQDILGHQNLILDMQSAPVKLKVATNANEKRVNAYIIYAHYLALILLPTMKLTGQKAVSEDPYETRETILTNYGSMTLSNVLKYLWDTGIFVLPLNDPGAFHGAYFRENYRHMIVLKHKTFSTSRWMFDALHETYHTLQNPRQPNLVLVEQEEMAKERLNSEEEITASQYAGAVLLGKNPQSLAEQCIKEANRDLRMLKSAVKRVALAESVPVDALANYLAFRLSLDGHNWWGAAENLQDVSGNPFLVAKNVLLEHVDLNNLADSDIQIVQRALIA